MPDSTLIVYGTDWCGDCRRVRRILDSNKIPYQWINIDQDKEAEKFVIQTNHGMRSVPTMIFADGSILVEPSNLALGHKLGVEV